MAHVTCASNANGGTLTITPPGSSGGVGPDKLRIYSIAVSVLAAAANVRCALIQFSNAAGPNSNGGDTIAQMFGAVATADGGTGTFHYNPAVPFVCTPGAVNIVYAGTTNAGVITNSNGDVTVTVVYDFV